MTPTSSEKPCRRLTWCWVSARNIPTHPLRSKCWASLRTQLGASLQELRSNARHFPQPWACSTQSSLSPSRGHSPELPAGPEAPVTPALVTRKEARSGSVHTTRKMAGPHPSDRSRKEGRSTAGHTLTHPRLPHRCAQEHRTRQPAVETGAARTHRRQRRVTSPLFSLHFRPGV